jgi:serine/threonine-protein kinase
MLGHLYLGKYKTVRLLDEGGMSKVYVAHQADLNRDVVVKVLKESLRASPKPRAHFRREIHIMSRFRHPHAVAFFDADPNDRDGPVLVMEYLRGVDLNVLRHRQGRLTPERAGRLLGQLCDVLQAAHDAGIVHRDLKPGNLMILHPGTPQETLKLMDFGLAKMSSLFFIAADEMADFATPTAAGTPEYIAPEQVRSADMDARGDLYSVGVMLFELLAGRRPFDADTPEELMQAHLDDDPPGFASLGLGETIPLAVEKLVRACLAKHPGDRPSSARELFQRYEQALGKKLTLPRLSGLVPILRPPHVGGAAQAARLPSAVPPRRAADRYAVQQSVESVMPESMAMIKLKGFIHDLGGDIVESSPGLIRVRLAQSPKETSKGSGGFSFNEHSRPAPVALPQATELELKVERHDPSHTSRLTITLVLRPGGGALVTPEWRTRCTQISRDFQAYMMGR